MIPPVRIGVALPNYGPLARPPPGRVQVAPGGRGARCIGGSHPSKTVVMENGAQTSYHVCPLCEATCGLEIRTRGREVTGIRGDQADVFSHGFICPKHWTECHYLGRWYCRPDLCSRFDEICPCWPNTHHQDL